MLASCVFMQSYLMKGKNKTGILDPLNELHPFCLHYTYLPRINKSLEEFVDQMNQRPVSTEHMSPLQLWTSGILWGAVVGNIKSITYKC